MGECIMVVFYAEGSEAESLVPLSHITILRMAVLQKLLSVMNIIRWEIRRKTSTL